MNRPKENKYHSGVEKAEVCRNVAQARVTNHQYTLLIPFKKTHTFLFANVAVAHAPVCFRRFPKLHKNHRFFFKVAVAPAPAQFYRFPRFPHTDHVRLFGRSK